MIKRILFSILLSMCLVTPGFAANGDRVIEGITADMIETIGLDVTGVTDGNIPFMQPAGAGFGDSPLSRTDATTVTITGTDPVTVYDVSTATDVDYWAGVVSDNDGVADANDLFQIGTGTVPGTTPLVTVQGSTGFVGIGTAGPSQLLDIEGSNGDLLLIGTNHGDASVRGAFGYSAAGASTMWVANKYIDDASTFGIRMKGSAIGNEVVTIKGGGNVGINTTLPQSLLDVQGPAGTGTATAGKLTLATKELTVVAGDELGRINFNAPLESDGTDAILPGASIWAVAEGDFGAASNATSLVLATGASEAAAEKMRINSAGNVGLRVSVLENWDPLFTALQIGGNGSLMSNVSPGNSTIMVMAHNGYYDDIDNRWEYMDDNEASRYFLSNGTHVMETAAAGTADNPITWTTAQTITSAGLTQFGTAAGAGQVNITPASAIDGLYINMAGKGANAIELAGDVSSDWSLTVNNIYGVNATQSVAGGRGLQITRNNNSVETYPLVQFGDSHAATTQPTLFVDHNGTGGATGYGLHVDSENAAGPAVKIEGGTSGILLDLSNDATTPTLAFGDGDSGFYESSDDALKISIAGADKVNIDANGLNIVRTGAGWLLDEVATSTNPTILPSNSDSNTGLGWAESDQLSLIAGGSEGIRITEATPLMSYEKFPVVGAAHGGYVERVFYATSGALTGATDKIELDIPAGWVIKQCQLHVKTAVVDDAGDDTWSSELNDGAQEEVISAGSAAAQNTNVNFFAHADAGYGGTLTDAETDILLTPQGGSFSSGEIEATCLAVGFTAWTNE